MDRAGTSGNNEAADWKAIAVVGNPTLSEPWVRGHIPNKLNGSVGGSYGRYVQTQRLVDKDPFWLTVTQ